MSDLWTWPAYIGVLVGTVLFVALLVPILLVQARRYGRVSGARLVGSAALAVYGVALVAYTLLPLPSGDVAAWCAEHAYEGFNADPLTLVRDIRDVLAERGLSATLRSAALLQGVFNVVLFIPWGIIARRFWGWGLWRSTASAFAASLLIEVTQYTGIFGLIGCSYRYADIDDLITNTLGGVIGALIAPVVLRWMPQAQALAAQRGTPRPVTVWRRWLGMVGDASIFVATGVVLAVAWRSAYWAATGTADDPWWAIPTVAGLLPLLLVFVLPQLGRSGASLGQRIVWLAPVRDGAPPSPGRRVLRFLGGGGMWALLGTLADFTDAAGWTEPWAGLAWLLGFVCVVAVPLTRGRRGLSGVVAGLDVVDARATAGSAPVAQPVP